MAVNSGQHKNLSFTDPPQRVVSLVPSLTESLFDLGFGSSLVGATDYCVEPAAGVANLQRVGGTKNPRIEDILALKPDLVLANQEENSPQTVQALEAAGINVWVSFPRSVHGAMDVLWVLVGIYRDKQAAIKLETIELSLGWLEQSAVGRIGKRYFCPIWYEAKSSTDQWWMTFNQNTYCHDLLRLCGGENVFAWRERRYPLKADLGLAASADPTGRDTRYPRGRQPWKSARPIPKSSCCRVSLTLSLRSIETYSWKYLRVQLPAGCSKCFYSMAASSPGTAPDWHAPYRFSPNISPNQHSVPSNLIF